jgi:hypothetical protein
MNQEMKYLVDERRQSLKIEDFIPWEDSRKTITYITNYNTK